MGKKGKPDKAATVSSARPSALLDTRVIYCGDNCGTSVQSVSRLWSPPNPSSLTFMAYIECMSTDLAASGGRPRCVELARVLKKTGSFCYHCDWHASHYAKKMLVRLVACARNAHIRVNAIGCIRVSDQLRSDQ